MTHNHTFAADLGLSGSASWKLEPCRRIHWVLLWFNMVSCGFKRRHDSVTLFALLQVRGCPVFGSILFLVFNRHPICATCLVDFVLFLQQYFDNGHLSLHISCSKPQIAITSKLPFTLKHALVHKEYDLSVIYTNISRQYFVTKESQNSVKF